MVLFIINLKHILWEVNDTVSVRRFVSAQKVYFGRLKGYEVWRFVTFS